jgi:UDP-N-acetylglucosamine 3-dehydrogenase
VHRIGIVGSNLYGRIHAQAFAKHPRATVVGLALARGDHETDLASQLGIRRYDSVSNLLDETGPDVLCICSGTAQHAEHALLAVGEGLHVLCERPIAMQLEQAMRIRSAVSEACVTFMVGHVLRFWPEYVEARKILSSGELGRILSVTPSRVSGTLSSAWRQRLLNADLGLGVLEALVHDMDYLGWLLGMPGSVYAHGLRASSGAWGQVQCLIEFPTGQQAQSEASYLVPLTFPLYMYLRVLAEKGALVYQFQGALSDRGTSTREIVISRLGDSPEELEVPVYDAYEQEVDYFLSCVEDGKQPELGTVEQAIQALSMILTVADSATEESRTSPDSVT